MWIIFTACLIPPLMFALFIPQGVFGMCVAYRSRGPLHTDETGFPLYD